MWSLTVQLCHSRLIRPAGFQLSKPTLMLRRECSHKGPLAYQTQRMRSIRSRLPVNLRAALA